MEKLKSIEVARGVAACLVVLFHASYMFVTKNYPENIPPQFFLFGRHGVEFFFVLSGFIIFYVNENKLGDVSEVGSYLKKRLIRIYPIYWIASFIAFIYFFWGERSHHDFSLQFLVESFFLIPQSKFPFLDVAWSLQYEVFFYILFIVFFFNKKIGYFMITVWFGSIIYSNYFFDFRTISYKFVLKSYNLLFCLGIYSGIFLKKKEVPYPLFFGFLGCLGFLMAGALEVYFYPFNRDSFWVPIYGTCSVLIILGFVSYERKKTIHIPEQILLLGSASYSIYLIHIVILKFMTTQGPQGFLFSIDPSIGYLILVSIGIGGGVLLHIGIERPFLKLLKKLF